MIKRLIFFSFFLIMFLFPVFSNPFTQKKNSPTPVQKKQTNENVMAGMRFLSDKLACYLEDWKNNSEPKLLFMTLIISFAYGFVHALAPGHRKIVVFMHFLSRKSKAYEPALLGFALSMIHAFSALMLMLIFKGVSGAISVAVNNTEIYMEGISFIVLILLSIYEIMEAIFALCKKKEADEKKLKLTAVLLSSFYPCPAAMLILIFATNLKVFSLGIFAILAMSFGMALPIIASGYLAWFGRTAVFTKIRENERLLKNLAACVQILSFSFLLFISIKIALPFILGLFSQLNF